MVEDSFSALKRSAYTSFNLLEEYFVELVHCIGKYAKNSYFPNINLEALDLLQLGAKRLIESPDMINNFI